MQGVIFGNEKEHWSKLPIEAKGQKESTYPQTGPYTDKLDYHKVLLFYFVILQNWFSPEFG